jgi:thiosulfate/3-mercaptopyruvate sulfurtransferase
LDTPVVCYDTLDGKWAARAQFVLTTWGFKDVRILNGGLKAWGDRKTESGESRKPNDKDFNFTYNSAAVTTFETIQAITSGEVKSQIVDARPAAAF